MKEKVLVIAGLLALACIAMVVPVMADGNVGANGSQASNFSVTVTNTSVNFGTFTVGSNTISPTHPDSHSNFSVVQVYSNDPNWYVQVSGSNSGHMKSSAGYTLFNALTIQNATVVTGGINSPLTLTGSGTGKDLLTETPLNPTDVPVTLEQTIIPTDTAASDYAISISIVYSVSA